MANLRNNAQHHGYATYRNAYKKLTDVVGETDLNIDYVIGVNEKGRFVPIVIKREGDRFNIGALIHQGITVIG